jgi:hypothetical protein
VEAEHKVLSFEDYNKSQHYLVDKDFEVQAVYIVEDILMDKGFESFEVDN